MAQPDVLYTYLEELKRQLTAERDEAVEHLADDREVKRFDRMIQIVEDFAYFPDLVVRLSQRLRGTPFNLIGYTVTRTQHGQLGGYEHDAVEEGGKVLFFDTLEEAREKARVLNSDLSFGATTFHEADRRPKRRTT